MQCYLIKEIEQMRVGISANNEAKAQLAKLYFEVKINVSKVKEKKDNVTTNKTLIMKEKQWLTKN